MMNYKRKYLVSETFCSLFVANGAVLCGFSWGYPCTGCALAALEAAHIVANLYRYRKGKELI